jgi:anti-anti-sigma factor
MLNVNVVSLKGDLDYLMKRTKIAEELTRLELFGRGATVILDLKDVEYADSTFAAALIRLERRMLVQQPDSRICIASPQPIVSRLFGLLHLDRMFPTFTSVSVAYQYHCYRFHLLQFQNTIGPGEDLDYGVAIV